MNNVTLTGRLTRDPQFNPAQGEKTAMCRFTLAVNRGGKAAADGTRPADFISCVAFSKTAEFINQYFKKGSAAAVTGSIRTGSYDNKDGVKVYTTDVYVNTIEFNAPKSAATEDAQATPPASQMTPVDDDDLPFN